MNSQNRGNIITLLQKNTSQMRQFGVERLGIFGSFIHGTQTEASDVDILVEFHAGQKTYRNYIGLSEYMENLLQTKVELVTPQSLSPYIAPHIKKDIMYVQVAD